MRELSQVLGLVGTMIVAIGYLPQILHLAREHCSAGISVSAWWIWLVSSVLIATHAFGVFDLVLITLQTVNIIAITLTIYLARRYEGMTCAFHRLLASQAVEGAIVKS